MFRLAILPIIFAMHSASTLRSDSAANSDRSAVVARGRRLEYLTIAWNGFEAAVALISGLGCGQRCTGWIRDGLRDRNQSAGFCCGGCVRWQSLRNVSDQNILPGGSSAHVSCCWPPTSRWNPLCALDTRTRSTQCCGNPDRRRSHHRHAAAGASQAARRSRTGQPRDAFRFTTGRFLRLPVRYSLSGAGAQHAFRMVVGRSCRRTGNGSDHRARRRSGTARGGLRRLRALSCVCPRKSISSSEATRDWLPLPGSSTPLAETEAHFAQADN